MRFTTKALVSSAAALSIILLGATAAEAAPATPSTSSISVFKKRHVEKHGLGSDEFYLVAVSITNNTTASMSLMHATLGHSDGSDGGHWNIRPTDIQPGQTILTSAYSAIQGQGIYLTYWGRDDQGQNATIYLDASDPAIGSNSTVGTSVNGGLKVSASISSGRQASATFVVNDPS